VANQHQPGHRGSLLIGPVACGTACNRLPFAGAGRRSLYPPRTAAISPSGCAPRCPHAARSRCR